VSGRSVNNRWGLWFSLVDSSIKKGRLIGTEVAAERGSARTGAQEGRNEKKRKGKIMACSLIPLGLCKGSLPFEEEDAFDCRRFGEDRCISIGEEVQICLHFPRRPS
jgi:hypothetical protein